MPSWQARLSNLAVRVVFRRRRWGRDERGVVRRARLLMGAPLPLRWLCARGLRVEPVRQGSVRGEWLTPRDPAPGVVLYLHGGGYVSSSAARHRPIPAALARLGGVRVFSLDYRLAPEHRFPAALDDALAAYLWLVEEQRVPPDALALAGDSAGGGLALSTLVRVRGLGLPLPACAVCFSPWTDLAGTGDSTRANDGRCAMFHPENVPEFAAAYLGGASPTDPAASPVYAELGGLPPLLLQVGSTEVLLDDARRVHEKVRAAGGSSRLEVFADTFHVWQMLDGLIPEAHTALRQAAAFIQTHLDTAVEE